MERLRAAEDLIPWSGRRRCPVISKGFKFALGVVFALWVLSVGGILLLALFGYVMSAGR